MFDSISATAVRSALDGLAVRQRTIADNIANINTPHFLAGKVDFETALRDAVDGGSGVAAATVDRSAAPTREDGNNVNLDAESLAGIDTQLKYELMTRVVHGQLSSISTAVKG